MIPKYVQNSEIYSEFSPEEQEQYFDLSMRAVRSHIDTLYYFIRLSGDTVNVQDERFLRLVSDLDYLKEKKKSDYSMIVMFHDLSVEAAGYSIYEYRLSFAEMFDIFISSYIPNEVTPRIVVQLRTRSLVVGSGGPYEAVRVSLYYVKNILEEYGIGISLIDVNRVDYAYHTNLIQNPIKYFSDEKMLKHLCSTMRKYMKIGTIGEDLTLETLSLGQRKSNNIFYRSYDKTREVIEKAYKSFFIDKWKEDRLISEYDYYVLMYAYKMGSYVAGIHLGKMNWYLEHGKDEIKKSHFRELIQKYHIKTDDNREFDKNLNGVLPDVTLIMNIEYQTKRKFYTEITESLSKVPVLDCEPELQKVFSVIAYRSAIQKYLTTETVCWVKDRKAKEKVPCDWWKRIQQCEIEGKNEYASLVRKRDLNSDIEKTERRLKNTIAHLQIIRNRSTEAKTFHEDFCDMLSYLNDNDFYGFQSNPESSRAFRMKEKDYGAIRERKARQDRGLIKSIEAHHEELQNRIQSIVESDEDEYTNDDV